MYNYYSSCVIFNVHVAAEARTKTFPLSQNMLKLRHNLM